MARFLAEYGLSTKEGVALMCLAEAMLRVPDTLTIDALISDKVVPGDWGRHLGSGSPLVNASTWALLLTGNVLSEDETEGLAQNLRGVVRRLGEPIVRTAVARAMTELGQQFVLGRTIGEAMRRAATLEQRGYTFSFDMLGEAARTEPDAARYQTAYRDAIAAIATTAGDRPVREAPGISVKLSALHPRYEYAKRATVVSALIERAGALARQASEANIGFNIDAEEADRLDLSLDIVEGLLAQPQLAGWEGLGVVVQAYSQRALPLIAWLDERAKHYGRRIMVRLVKGAYWDTEIKRAQTLGLSGFPVFTRKPYTDISYLACARQLLDRQDRIYAQFATHNAHTAAAVLWMSPPGSHYELQRLHGMGEALHDLLLGEHGTQCRIYAPVGSHQNLLAYLVRRLLENGANSSFVNQIVDKSVPVEEIANDPLVSADPGQLIARNGAIAAPCDVYGTARRNAKGWDLADPLTVAALDRAREQFRGTRWQAAPMPTGPRSDTVPSRLASNPADNNDIVGEVMDAIPADIDDALDAAVAAFPNWASQTAEHRAGRLEQLADLYEANAAELIALCAREAGKTLPDAVAEIREAVDFCRYYAVEARRSLPGEARGVFVCISPWNFPLAIFTGQIAAALLAGNTVIAKPAEQTPLIATRAVSLMYEADVPQDVIQLLPGDGPKVGAALVADRRIAGVCFTGSTETAQHINRAMAERVAPDAPLIAETGGLNAMIVDSTALPEQAVRDVLTSAFQSAGQRCSALRILYVQEDVAEKILVMLSDAMDTLSIGDPWHQSTDIGPVIDRAAKAALDAHCLTMDAADRRLKRLVVPARVQSFGFFVPPAIYRVAGIAELEREVFGPILHVATFKAEQLDSVVEDINRAGYGLTLGIHTRVDRRVQRVIDRAKVGNTYVNRNQIGAIVGSQPFGGEGLSGTGPKAGGPLYLNRFRRPAVATSETRSRAPIAPTIPRTELQAAINALEMPQLDPKRLAQLAALFIDAATLTNRARALAETIDLPGPTGESNRLSIHPRGIILCLGAPGRDETVTVIKRQAAAALAVGNAALLITPEALDLTPEKVDGPVLVMAGSVLPADLTNLTGFAGVAVSGAQEDLGPIRQGLAARDGPILPLIEEPQDLDRYIVERAVCIDTTAAGGNASLLVAAGN